MKLFLAHENLQRTGDDVLICLPDRFDWFAFLLPPIWAISKGLWGVLSIMLIVILGLTLALEIFSLPFFTLLLLGAWWLGFEANSLISAKLVRGGWGEAEVFFAPDLMQAERKFFGRKRRLARRANRQNNQNREQL